MDKTFPASLDNLYEMLAFVREQSRSFGFDLINVSKIELACEETLVNIISYSYPHNKGSIEIECTRTEPAGIKIEIRDGGVAFNPILDTKKIQDTVPVEKKKIGGYGIILMRKLMDEVKYNRDNNLNVLILTKYLKKSSQ